MMKINVDRLLSEGWRFYDLGKTPVLIAPEDSELLKRAARLEPTTYNGKVIHFFKYHGFPWDDYARQEQQ